MPEPSAPNLWRLLWLRNIAIFSQAVAMAVVHMWVGIPLPLAPMGIALAMLLLLNLATWWRLAQQWSITRVEFFCQLLADLLALTVVLYFSGGSGNPFVSLYLLPLVVAATVLPYAYAWAVAGVSVICYTLLMFWYVPLALPHTDHTSAFSLHITVMWLTFVLSAGLIAHFIVRMASSLRERDLMLAVAREKSLRDEKIFALGALAAGAAHELSTPLSTIAVLAHDLDTQYRHEPDVHADLRTLRTQVNNCKEIISGLLAEAGHARAEGGGHQAVDKFLSSTLERWRLLRPGVQIESGFSGSQPPPHIISELALAQTLITLLNNAADASPDHIEVEGCWNARELSIEVRDRGAGIAPEIASRIGKEPFTTKAPGKGHGLGLLLAHASIQRLGGSVKIRNRDGGGLCTRVLLPLDRLSVASA